MKRSWQLVTMCFLTMQTLLFLSVGNIPVCAKHSGLAKISANPSSVRQEQILVNAIQGKAVLVKDKRVFQDKLVRTADRYASNSSFAPMDFHKPHAFYCSGFVQEFYRDNGIWIPAHSVVQQTKFGVRIAKIDQLEPGDLVFFGNPPSDNVPAHVAISLGRGKLLHPSGGRQNVSVLELTDELRRYFMFANRLVSSV